MSWNFTQIARNLLSQELETQQILVRQQDFHLAREDFPSRQLDFTQLGRILANQQEIYLDRWRFPHLAKKNLLRQVGILPSQEEFSQLDGDFLARYGEFTQLDGIFLLSQAGFRLGSRDFYLSRENFTQLAGNPASQIGISSQLAKFTQGFTGQKKNYPAAGGKEVSDKQVELGVT